MVQTWRQSDRRGAAPEHRHVFRSASEAGAAVLSYVARGHRKVGPRTPSRRATPIVAGWHRGGGLWVVRATAA